MILTSCLVLHSTIKSSKTLLWQCWTKVPPPPLHNVILNCQQYARGSLDSNTSSCLRCLLFLPLYPDQFSVALCCCKEQLCLSLCNVSPFQAPPPPNVISGHLKKKCPTFTCYAFLDVSCHPQCSKKKIFNPNLKKSTGKEHCLMFCNAKILPTIEYVLILARAAPLTCWR